MPSREYYLQAKSESEYVQAYLNFMRGVVSLLGSTEIPVDDQLMDLLEFETKLANVSTRSFRCSSIVCCSSPALLTLFCLHYLKFVNTILTHVSALNQHR